MNTYSFFDGEKWVEQITAAQVKALAEQGIITPSTPIRMPNGKEALAEKIAGLEFAVSTVVPSVPNTLVSPVLVPTLRKPFKKYTVITASSVVIVVVLIISSIFFLKKISSNNIPNIVPKEDSQKTVYVKSEESNDPLFHVQQEYDRVYIPKNYSHQVYLTLFKVSYNEKESQNDFFEIDGKPAELAICSITPDIVEEHTKLLNARRWKFKKPGLAEFEISIGDQKKYRSIDVVEFPYELGSDSKDIIRNEGFPDIEKSVKISSNFVIEDGFFEVATNEDFLRKHWKYKKYPGLTIAIIGSELIKITSESNSDIESE